ncbi:GNAT family N-acetyltransferase [Chitiniphilus shinanonensis]|uniref:GNAT family N-acetyltransferase n=1 Tax=Chitiniphilus shinanonensis TaxID=553088 RepID=UPI003059FB92
MEQINTMDRFLIEGDDFFIVEFDGSMAEAVHKNSLDEDCRRFLPDEVFETVEEAHAAIAAILDWYQADRAPLVYAIILKSGENIGYVQAVPIYDAEWEIGYHVARNYAGKGYATEAVKVFLPVIMNLLSIKEIAGLCIAENVASCKVMEKNGFALEYRGLGNYQESTCNICRYRYSVQ